MVYHVSAELWVWSDDVTRQTGASQYRKEAMLTELHTGMVEQNSSTMLEKKKTSDQMVKPFVI